MLLGPDPNYIIWRDCEGHEHRQDLARECLYIWLVPGDFEPPFPRFPSEPWGGETLFSSKSIGAYGFATHEITNRARFEAIMEEATRSGWGEVRISWRSWKRDIADSLKK